MDVSLAEAMGQQGFGVGAEVVVQWDDETDWTDNLAAGRVRQIRT